MKYFDMFAPKGGAEKSPDKAAKPAEVPANHILAIPVAAKSRETPDKTLIFYAYLFSDSPKEAVQRVGEDLRDSGIDLRAVTGPILATTLEKWTDFVGKNFDWMKDTLPTAKQLGEQNRGVIYYSSKIVQS